jgi:hypothetical protein
LFVEGAACANEHMAAATTALSKITALLTFIADELEKHPAKVRFMAQFDAMYARHSLLTRDQRELERERQRRIQDAHGVAPRGLLEETGGMGRQSAKGAYVEVEGELRYREYTPAESDRGMRIAEIHATSILALDRSAVQPSSASAESNPDDEPVD